LNVDWNSELQGFSINHQEISHPQFFRACEEARDRRHGESSLPPAATNSKQKGESQCLV
jgi:hypothetical protein